MRNKIIAVGIFVALLAGPAIAADGGSKEEGVGVGAGAIIGGAVGGPAGAIVGAAIGAKLGDSINQRKEQVASLDTSLKSSRERVASLEKDVDLLASDNEALNDDLRELQSIARPELLSLMQAGIEMDLLFRTDEHVLSDATGQRLKSLAGSLAAMPDVRIRLDGFADERGDAAYNQELSERRATYVRDMLVASGIPLERIKISAHGESDAADDTVDSYALERKVSLTLFVDESTSFASNPAQ